jgi:hypothetical protein
LFDCEPYRTPKIDIEKKKERQALGFDETNANAYILLRTKGTRDLRAIEPRNSKRNGAAAAASCFLGVFWFAPSGVLVFGERKKCEL